MSLFFLFHFSSEHIALPLRHIQKRVPYQSKNGFTQSAKSFQP